MSHIRLITLAAAVLPLAVAASVARPPTRFGGP